MKDCKTYLQISAASYKNFFGIDDARQNCDGFGDFVF